MLKFIITNPTSIEVRTELLKDDNGIEIYKFTADNVLQSKVKTISISFKLPSKGAFSVWNSECTFDRNLKPDWRMSEVNSRVTSGAPVQQITGMDGNNKVNISVLDAATPLTIKTGIIEETAEILCKIDFFTGNVSEFRHYETQIRIDQRPCPYYDILADVRKWWRIEAGYIEPFIPETVRKPVNSIWYSFHQKIDTDYIVEQCYLSKKLGMNSVIIDDGWQTNDSNRGYYYCGDWEVCKSKIDDMKNFVDRVHETGLKFMLWYSVPFVGKYSKAYKRFKGKCSNFNGETACLDPRYKEVRDYLINIYEKAVIEWGIDGLKLDFIDEFKLPAADDVMDEGRDFESIEEAVEKFLSEIRKRLTEIKHDICIEFRQTYTGPIVLTCGNMLRVMDCPADSLRNRVGSIDVRMLSGKVPVHSDMIMWDLNDTPENAALQIINVLFSVPQISMLIDRLPKSHYEMLRFYLEFWNRNSPILLFGRFRAENPEANYSIASAESDSELIAVAFAKNVLSIDKEYERIVFVNGTGKYGLIVERVRNKVKYRYRIIDCCGNEVENGIYKGEDMLKSFKVPKSGMAELVQLV